MTVQPQYHTDTHRPVGDRDPLCAVHFTHVDDHPRKADDRPRHEDILNCIMGPPCHVDTQRVLLCLGSAAAASEFAQKMGFGALVHVAAPQDMSKPAPMSHSSGPRCFGVTFRGEASDGHEHRKYWLLVPPPLLCPSPPPLCFSALLSCCFWSSFVRSYRRRRFALRPLLGLRVSSLHRLPGMWYAAPRAPRGGYAADHALFSIKAEVRRPLHGSMHFHLDLRCANFPSLFTKRI